MKKMKVMLVILSLSLMGLSCTKETTTDQTGDQPTSQSEEQQVIDRETEDWQIYRHTGPDYKLKHLESWYTRLTPNPTMGDLEFLNVSTTKEEFTLTDCSFGVTTWDSSHAGSKKTAQERAIETSEVEIDGVKAEKYIWPPNDEYMSHSHYFKKGDYWYTISFQLKKDKPAEPCLDILNKILGTFKFGQ